MDNNQNKNTYSDENGVFKIVNNPKEEQKKSKVRTLLSKQKTMIAILSAVAVLLAICYFFVFPNLEFFKEELVKVPKYSEYGDEVEVQVYDAQTGKYITGSLIKMLNGTEENLYEVKPGEDENTLLTFRRDYVTVSYVPYVFPEIQKNDVKRITVENEHGTFTAYQINGEFYIEGAESNLYNSTNLSNLVFNARYMLSDGYVENVADDLGQYGLTDDTCSAKVTVEDTLGKRRVIYIGDMASDSNYYVKLEDKDQIYLLDTGCEVFFNKITYFLSASAVVSLGDNDTNYLDNFTIKKNGEEYFSCRILTDEERVGFYSNQLHKMTYPQPEHVLDTLDLYEMFSMAGNLSGTSVVEFGVSKLPNKDEILEKYGLLSPIAEVSYSLSGTDYYFAVGSMTETGEFFVYSPYQDTVIIASYDALAFIDYDLIELYQDQVFQYRIDLISEIEIISPTVNAVFALTGEGQQLQVVEKNSAKAMDVPSFRQFYISLLNVSIGGYSALPGGSIEGLTHELTFNVTMRTGEKVAYEFYSESPISCYMVVGGNGGFKSDNRHMTDIKNKAQMLLDGITIESSI